MRPLPSQKRVNRLEVQMKPRDLVEAVGVQVARILNEDVLHHALYVLGRGRDMRTHAHVLSLSPKPARNGVVDAADEHLVQEQYQLLIQFAIFRSGALVFGDAGQIPGFKNLPHRHLAREGLLQQDPFGLIECESGVFYRVRVVDALGDFDLVDHRQQRFPAPAQGVVFPLESPDAIFYRSRSSHAVTIIYSRQNINIP